MANDLTLTSTSDTLEQVQAALGIPQAEQVADAPPPVAETPPAQPGVVSATVKPAEKGKAAAAAPAAAVASPTVPVAPVVAAPAPEVVAEPAAPTGDADDDADEDEAPPVADPAESAAAAALGKKGGQARGKLQARVRTLLTTAQQQKSENASLRARIAALEAGASTAASPAAPVVPGATATPAPAPAARPVLADFESYEDWVTASTKYDAKHEAEIAVANALKAERDRTTQAQADSARDIAVAAYRERMVDAQLAHEDFDEVVGNPELETSPLMRDVILHSEIGPEVAYYLGQNPDLCKKVFAAGNTAQAATMLGRVEAKVESQLEAAKAAAKPAAAAATTLAAIAGKATPPVAAAAPAAPAAPAKPVTQAPDPIEPVGTSTVGSSKAPDTMSFQEYKDWRKAGGGRR